MHQRPTKTKQFTNPHKRITWHCCRAVVLLLCCAVVQVWQTRTAPWQQTLVSHMCFLARPYPICRLFSIYLLTFTILFRLKGFLCFSPRLVLVPIVSTDESCHLSFSLFFLLRKCYCSKTSARYHPCRILITRPIAIKSKERKELLQALLPKIINGCQRRDFFSLFFLKLCNLSEMVMLRMPSFFSLIFFLLIIL